jgi:hypothetical protein
MNFDKNSLSALLKLSDEELTSVIKDIATEAGVGSENLKIGKGDLMKIRTFLKFANDDDIKSLLTQFGGKKQ